MRLALAQMNSVVGDLDGNRDRILGRLDEARAAGADLVALPGARRHRLPARGPAAAARRSSAPRARSVERDRRARRAASPRSSARRTSTPTSTTPATSSPTARSAASTASASCPNYGVFDEDRYFAPGARPRAAPLRRRRSSARRSARTSGSPARPRPTSRSPARSSSPTSRRRRSTSARTASARRCCASRARDNSCFVALCNAVGGQDELIFDGHSVVLDDEGEVVARAPGFEEALLVVDVDPVAAVGRRLRDVRRRALARERARAARRRAIELAAAARAGRACCTRSRRRSSTTSSRCAWRSSSGCATTSTKNGFGDVVIGLSGGIDSALTAALAVEALGAERVHGVSMPSRYSSEATRADAQRLAESLGIDFREIAIEPVVEAFTGVARAVVRRAASPTSTEENLQARIRGTLLMALSNKFGWLVIATGNKSELSVGYSTLYGDLAGGFALLKDVYKTDVFRLARRLNERAGRELIPQSIIDRAAERRAARRPARRGLAAAVRAARPRCSRPTSSSTARARSSPRTASTRTSSSARSR